MKGHDHSVSVLFVYYTRNCFKYILLFAIVLLIALLWNTFLPYEFSSNNNIQSISSGSQLNLIDIKTLSAKHITAIDQLHSNITNIITQNENKSQNINKNTNKNQNYNHRNNENTAARLQNYQKNDLYNNTGYVLHKWNISEILFTFNPI